MVFPKCARKKPAARCWWLEAVSDAHTGLRLPGNREPVVQIAANTDIEEPVTSLDLILDIQGQFLYIGVAEIV